MIIYRLYQGFQPEMVSKETALFAIVALVAVLGMVLVMGASSTGRFVEMRGSLGEPWQLGPEMSGKVTCNFYDPSCPTGSACYVMGTDEMWCQGGGAFPAGHQYRSPRGRSEPSMR